MAVLIVAAGDSVSKDKKISTELKIGGNSNAESFRFLLAYFVEVLLSLFVWYPIVTTILFSGVLSCCGRVPYLGGRPKVRDLERQMSQKERICVIITPPILLEHADFEASFKMYYIHVELDCYVDHNLLPISELVNGLDETYLSTPCSTSFILLCT
jgi:hypothetical protein